MDPQGGHDDDVLCWHDNVAATKGGLDFFSEPTWFPMAAASSSGHGGCPRRENNISLYGLHNFIRESALSDKDFDMCDQDEDYMPMPEDSSSQQSINNHFGDENVDMNVFFDSIADALYYRVYGECVEAIYVYGQ